MANVRTIHVDWYSQRPPRFEGGPQLAYQGDHLSNMVVFDNAPELPNYYLLVEMKTDDEGPVTALPAIQLEGPYWVIPNYYTQICQIITYQVCCKTGTNDYEHHSAKFTGTILPVITHNGEPIDQSPMFDPYIDILDKRVNELVVAAGGVQIDSELKDDSGNPVQNRVVKAAIDELGDNVETVNGRLVQIFNGNALLDGVGTDINWEVGYIDASGVPKPGNPSGGNYYCYTNLIPCEKSVVINATAGYKCRYFIYDKESGAYVSAIGNQNIPYNITLTDATKSYRVAWLLKAGATQAEAQAAAEEMENYITITAQSEPAITEEKLDAIGIASKSYVDESVGKFVWHSGYVWPDDGVVYPGQQTGGRCHVYSDMVWSEYGLHIDGSRNLRWFRYEKDGTYITGVGYQTAPVSLDLPGGYAYRIQLLGGTATEAEEIISGIDDYVTIRQKSASDTGWIEFLPVTDIYIGDVQQRIYFNELARYNENDGYFIVSASGATYPVVTYTDRYVEFNPTQAVDVTLTISYYYRDTLSATKTLTAHCKTAPFSAKKVMFLGDSYTQNGGMVKWFKDHNTNNVTLYGTRETTIDGVTYQHEGRGGWTAGNYLNNASVGAVANPFYNPSTQTFDFSYYMSNDGSAFTDVEIVNILLGRNSGFPVSNMDNLDLIVASIKAYNPNIMVVLMCDSNLAADNSGAGAYMQNVHTANKQSHIYNKAFYERYKDSTDVVMCFANLNLDNVYDFAFEEVDASIINPTKVKRYTDNVHPWNIPGLGKFGIALNGLLRNVLN